MSCSAAAVANPWQRAAVIPNQVLSGRKLRRRVWLAAAVALTVGVRQLPATDVRARGPLARRIGIGYRILQDVPRSEPKM